MTSTRRGWNAPVNRSSETDEARQTPIQLDVETPDPYDGEPKWPAWRVTIAVIVFCSAFWAGVGYIATHLPV